MPPETFPPCSSLSQPRLRNLALLRSFSAADREALEAAGRTTSVEEGVEVIREGQSHGRLFIILAGRFEVRRDGERVVELGVGQLCGEMEILNPPQSSASVTALTAAVVWSLSRNELRTFLESHPVAGAEFMRLLAMTFATRLQER